MANSNPSEEGKQSSVDRAISILGCFDQENPSLTLTAISRQTGLYKSTVLRLTDTLIAGGILVRDVNKAYRLGPAIGHLGEVYKSTYSVENEIQPFLYELREKTGESASYLIARGDKRVCQLQVNSKHRIRLHLEQGEEISMDSGASARLLRAFRGDRWEGSRDVLAKGWAISAGERDPEVASVAIAITGKSGKFHGAIAVSGPLHRFNEPRREEALELLKDVSEELKGRLI